MKEKILCAMLTLWVLLFTESDLQAKNLIDDPDVSTSEIVKEWDDPDQKAWKVFKTGVERKWKDFVHSTKKEWVSYDAEKDVRSVVDFEEGHVLFETIIPNDDPNAAEKAREKIGKQAEEIFREEDIPGKRILENLLVNTKGFSIDISNHKEFVIKEVAPGVRQVTEKSFLSKDGVARQTYTVRIPMVKGHTEILARKYLPLVQKYARKFDLKPELVLALIHTESYFNPRAVSHCGALGLMQLVPRSGGLQAYMHVYGQERTPSRNYLFNPENNIELGCGYFNWLKTFFKKVKSELKRRYVCICGYNCGPGNVGKVLKRHQIASMTDQEVYEVLRRETPEETRGYIKNVVSRMPIYVSLTPENDIKAERAESLWDKLVTLADHASNKVNVRTNQERFKTGDLLTITCDAEKDGYLTVISINPDDTQADILYPNKLHPDNYVAQGTITIPTPGDNFVLRCKPPSGQSLIVAFHTRENINLYQESKGKSDSLFRKMPESALDRFEAERKKGILSAGKRITFIE